METAPAQRRSVCPHGLSFRERCGKWPVPPVSLRCVIGDHVAQVSRVYDSNSFLVMTYLDNPNRWCPVPTVDCVRTELTISTIDAFCSQFVELHMHIPTLSDSLRSILYVDIGHTAAGLVRSEVLPV